MVALHDALSLLALIDERKAEAMEMRFFGGLSLGINRRLWDIVDNSVVRDLRMAEAWLRREIGPDAATLRLL